MRNISVLLIVPKFTIKGLPYTFPFGLAYISAVIKKKLINVDLEILNTNHFFESQEKLLERYLTNKKYDVALTGGMSFHWNLLEDIAAYLKKKAPNTISILGGPIVVSDIELMMENLDFTFSVTEEGEITIIELLERIASIKDNQTVIKQIEDFGAIAGINFRKPDGNIVMTPRREAVEPLDEVPFPDYEGFGFREFLETHEQRSTSMFFSHFDRPRIGYVLASRSCPYSCTFCFHPLGKKYRQRSLNNVFEEIDLLVTKYNINVLEVLDELFSVNKSRMIEFSNRIKKYNIKWLAQLRVTDVEPEILEQMRESGLFLISYGIESMDDKILCSMQKKITKAQIERALKLTREAKIGIQGNIILGDMEETYSSFQNSLEWFKGHPQYSLNLGIILAIPNSQIYQYAIKQGIIKNKLKHIREGFPHVNLTRMNDAEYKEMIATVTNFSKDYLLNGEPYYFYGKLKRKTEFSDYFLAEIECPECKITNAYHLRKSYLFQVNLFCKTCMFRMKFRMTDLYTVVKKIQIFTTAKFRDFFRCLNRKSIISNKTMEKLVKLYCRFTNYK